MKLDVKCDNFLKDNHHWYAVKATKKRIAIVRIEVRNQDSSAVQLILGSSKLTAGGMSCDAERPTVVIRKLSAFTWDFLLFSVADLFHPITALIEGLVFLTGPLYNRRMKRQLVHLSDGEMFVPPGEYKSVLVAFRGVSQKLERLTIPFRSGDTNEGHFDYDFASA